MIKMVALRTVYVPADRREYATGETFNVGSEVDAESYVRRKRAARAPVVEKERPRHVDIAAPTYQRRDMVAEQPKPEIVPEKKPATAVATTAGQTGKAR